MLFVAAQPSPPVTPRLELFPKRFKLYPGEQIHYSVVEVPNQSQSVSVDYEFAISDPEVLRPIQPKYVLEAVKPGRTELVVRTPTAQRRITIEVAGPAQPAIRAVHHSAMREIAGKDLLFVGHANRDGFDLTAVAKPGIDRLVKEAKKKGVPVVYWVSEEYPNWYTSDRLPDYAIVSEGQEHQIHIDAQRVVFTGGDFMGCVVRNAQMTLHGMVKHHARRIQFVFPTQAIWTTDIWDRGADKRPYPAAAVLAATVFARRADDLERYDQVVVPFLDRVIMKFPILGYPPDPPSPPLSELLVDWTIVVRFGDRFERVYRRGDPDKTVLVEFQGV